MESEQRDRRVVAATRERPLHREIVFAGEDPAQPLPIAHSGAALAGQLADRTRTVERVEDLVIGPQWFEQLHGRRRFLWGDETLSQKNAAVKFVQQDRVRPRWTASRSPRSRAAIST